MKGEKLHVICNHSKQCSHYDKCACLEDCRKILCKSYELKIDGNRIRCKNLVDDDTRVTIVPSRLREQREKCSLSLRNVEGRCWEISYGGIKYCETFSTPMEKSRCYFLAALYGTTPGYLMGQTDDENTDIYLMRYTFKKVDKTESKSRPIKIIAIYELSLVLRYFSTDRRVGMEAAQRIAKLVEGAKSSGDSENPEDSRLKLDERQKKVLLKFLAAGKDIYCETFPDQIQKELIQFVNALLIRDPFEAMFEDYEVKSRKKKVLEESTGHFDELHKEIP